MKIIFSVDTNPVFARFILQSLNVDRGFINAVVFLDLKKAFDTVDYSILLSKLQAYGIQGSTNQWFCSYLKNRTQTCLVNGNKSSKMFLRCGVPHAGNDSWAPSISII